MKALFVELPAFERNRSAYLTDEAFRGLQNAMLKDPEAGNVIAGTGGLRKVRHGNATRGKGKRGGLRIIYFWWEPKRRFWPFTLYDKDELDDLLPKEKTGFETPLKQELEERK